jgi:hypothetical protein
MLNVIPDAYKSYFCKNSYVCVLPIVLEDVYHYCVILSEPQMSQLTSPRAMGCVIEHGKMIGPAILV